MMSSHAVRVGRSVVPSSDSEEREGALRASLETENEDSDIKDSHSTRSTISANNDTQQARGSATVGTLMEGSTNEEGPARRQSARIRARLPSANNDSDEADDEEDCRPPRRRAVQQGESSIRRAVPVPPVSPALAVTQVGASSASQASEDDAVLACNAYDSSSEEGTQQRGRDDHSEVYQTSAWSRSSTASTSDGDRGLHENAIAPVVQGAPLKAEKLLRAMRHKDSAVSSDIVLWSRPTPISIESILASNASLRQANAERSVHLDFEAARASSPLSFAMLFAPGHAHPTLHLDMQPISNHNLPFQHLSVPIDLRGRTMRLGTTGERQADVFFIFWPIRANDPDHHHDGPAWSTSMSEARRRAFRDFLASQLLASASDETLDNTGVQNLGIRFVNTNTIRFGPPDRHFRMTTSSEKASSPFFTSGDKPVLTHAHLRHLNNLLPKSYIEWADQVAAHSIEIGTAFKDSFFRRHRPYLITIEIGQDLCLADGSYTTAKGRRWEQYLRFDEDERRDAPGRLTSFVHHLNSTFNLAHVGEYNAALAMNMRMSTPASAGRKPDSSKQSAVGMHAGYSNDGSSDLRSESDEGEGSTARQELGLLPRLDELSDRLFSRGKSTRGLSRYPLAFLGDRGNLQSKTMPNYLGVMAEDLQHRVETLNPSNRVDFTFFQTYTLLKSNVRRSKRAFSLARGTHTSTILRLTSPVTAKERKKVARAWQASDTPMETLLNQADGEFARAGIRMEINVNVQLASLPVMESISDDNDSGTGADNASDDYVRRQRRTGFWQQNELQDASVLVAQVFAPIVAHTTLPHNLICAHERQWEQDGTTGVHFPLLLSHISNDTRDASVYENESDEAEMGGDGPVSERDEPVHHSAMIEDDGSEGSGDSPALLSPPLQSEPSHFYASVPHLSPSPPVPVKVSQTSFYHVVMGSLDVLAPKTWPALYAAALRPLAEVAESVIDSLANAALSGEVTATQFPTIAQIELVSILDRLLAYGATGHARSLCKELAHLGLDGVKRGAYPSFDLHFVRLLRAPRNGQVFQIDWKEWPSMDGTEVNDGNSRMLRTFVPYLFSETAVGQLKGQESLKANIMASLRLGHLMDMDNIARNDPQPMVKAVLEMVVHALVREQVAVMSGMASAFAKWTVLVDPGETVEGAATAIRMSGLQGLHHNKRGCLILAAHRSMQDGLPNVPEDVDIEEANNIAVRLLKEKGKSLREQEIQEGYTPTQLAQALVESAARSSEARQFFVRGSTAGSILRDLVRLVDQGDVVMAGAPRDYIVKALAVLLDPEEPAQRTLALPPYRVGVHFVLKMTNANAFLNPNSLTLAHVRADVVPAADTLVPAAQALTYAAQAGGRWSIAGVGRHRTDAPQPELRQAYGKLPFAQWPIGTTLPFEILASIHSITGLTTHVGDYLRPLVSCLSEATPWRRYAVLLACVFAKLGAPGEPDETEFNQVLSDALVQYNNTGTWTETQRKTLSARLRRVRISKMPVESAPHWNKFITWLVFGLLQVVEADSFAAAPNAGILHNGIAAPRNAAGVTWKLLIVLGALEVAKPWQPADVRLPSARIRKSSLVPASEETATTLLQQISAPSAPYVRILFDSHFNFNVYSFFATTTQPDGHESDD